MPGEKPEDFDALLRGTRSDFEPRGTTQDVGGKTSSKKSTDANDNWNDNDNDNDNDDDNEINPNDYDWEHEYDEALADQKKARRRHRTQND